MGYFEFPHTRTYDNDLGWLIWAMKKMIQDWENFTEENSIQFADPITWDITKQYEMHTIVLDPDGNGYISRQAVPSGVALSNPSYWTQIFSFEAVANKIRDSIAVNAGSSATTPAALTTNELVWWNGNIYRAMVDMPAGTAFIEGTNVERFTVDDKFDLVLQDIDTDLQLLQDNIDTEAATRETADGVLQDNIDTEAAAREAADGALQNEIDELSAASAYYAVETVADMLALPEIKAGAIISTRGYYAVDDGGAGRYYVTDTGTIDNRLSYAVAGKVVSLIHADGEIIVNQIGAHGDGVNDDTESINWALQNFVMTKGLPDNEYLISATLVIPYGHSFDGQECTIRTVPIADFTAHGVANIEPAKIAIWLQGREPINHSEFAAYTKEVKNFRLIENLVDTGEEPSNGFCGFYLGYKTALTGTNSKVNYSVYGYGISNVSINGFRWGMYLAEVWDTKFDGVKVRDMLAEGICCRGQSVNIYWIGCNIDGRDRGNAVGFEWNVNPNYANRPEGHMLTGCAVFSCTYGLRQITALSIQVCNCMLDLHNNAAISMTIGDMLVSNSWISSKTGESSYTASHATVQLNPVATPNDYNKITLTGCHIVNRNDNAAQYPGAVMQKNGRYADIVEGCHIVGSVRQLNGDAALRILNNSFDDDATIYTANNGVRSGNYRGKTGAAMN